MDAPAHRADAGRRLRISGRGHHVQRNDVTGDEFALARRLGAYINLDDITHVDTLAQNGGVPETVCMRFNPGGTFRIGNAIMATPATPSTA